MIQLAGVSLPVPTQEIIDAVESNITLSRLSLFWNRAFPGFGTVGLALPTMYRPWPLQPLRLNRFYWPSGAARYGFGMFLASKDACNLIHDAAFGQDGTETLPVDLVLSSENQAGATMEAIQFSLMTVFPPVPLFRVLNPDLSSNFGMYLLCVVDDRFRWWNVPCPDFGITESAGKTWANIISKIGDALELTITVSPIDTAYLAPHRALNLTGEPIPLILDAIAFNIGMRVVVQPAGDVYLQDFNDGFTATATDNNSPAGQARTRRAGSSRFVDAF